MRQYLTPGTNESALASVVIILMIIVAAIATSSCGANYHLRRAKHHIARAEELGAEWHSDTLIKTIEIPIPEIHKDTLFQSKAGDTVVITKDRLKVVYVKLPGDSVFLEGECKDSIIYVPCNTAINKSIESTPAKENLPWWIKFLVGGLVVACLVLIFKR